MARNINLDSLDLLTDNAVVNIKEVFKLHAYDEARIRPSKYYDEDVDNPEPNSVAIDVVGYDPQLRSWVAKAKRNFLVYMTVHVWYYHEQVSDNTRSKEAKRIVGRLAQMFMKHSSINGFCDTVGSDVIGSEYIQRKLKNKIMSGGLVRLTLSKYHTVTNLD